MLYSGKKTYYQDERQCCAECDFGMETLRLGTLRIMTCYCKAPKVNTGQKWKVKVGLKWQQRY